MAACAVDGGTGARKLGAMPRTTVPVVVTSLLIALAGAAALLRANDSRTATAAKAVPLFPDKGEPKGWSVRAWDDVSKPGPDGAKWVVDEQGVLNGSEPRGTWLVSDREYGDFVLEFDFKLGERGNSGCGIRFPGRGDPAFDGLEIQMCDARYNDPPDTADKLTASLYKALAPGKQVYKPTEWNHYVITARGPRIKVELNGEVVQDVNLDKHDKPVETHQAGKFAVPLKDRPRRGHIGFQELSRGGGHAQIRNARITVLD
jgi:hypothetical protein